MAIAPRHSGGAWEESGEKERAPWQIQPQNVLRGRVVGKPEAELSGASTESTIWGLATGVWLWLMSADTGLVAVLLGKMGIGEGVTWRLTPGYFTALLIIIDLWRAIGFNMIILTAGMKNIPNDLYEASTIDGASTFQQWIHITIPMLEPVLFFVVVNCFIGAIQTYDIPWVLSNSSAVGVIGGKNAFASYPVMEIVGNVYSGKAGNLGRACAEGFVLMLIIFAITLLQIVYRNCKNKDN